MGKRPLVKHLQDIPHTFMQQRSKPKWSQYQSHQHPLQPCSWKTERIHETIDIHKHKPRHKRCKQ